MLKNYWLKVLFLLGLLALVGCLPAPAPVLDISKTDTEFCMTQEGLEKIQQEYFNKGIAAGCPFDVKLNNPTYAQLQQFLKDNKALTECQGNCVERAIDLNDAADEAGWNSYVVLLNDMSGKGHVITAFNTKDKGLIYIEPQTLWEVKVEKNFDYSENYRSHGWNFPPFVIEQIGVLR